MDFAKETAVSNVLTVRYRTFEFFNSGDKVVNCAEVGDLVAEAI